MSTNPHHRCHRQPDPDRQPAVRRTGDLFVRANPFLDVIWHASEAGHCLTAGCSDCGALDFRRMLAALDGAPPEAPLNVRRAAPTEAPTRLAIGVASLDFDLLRLAPRWYDALDVALFHLRDHGGLGHVLDDWLHRPSLPVRVLDLVLFRHARYGYPDERLADLWIERCLDASCESGDEGLVESLILACPERVGADPRALRTALDAAARSACVRAVVRRLGDCA